MACLTHKVLTPVYSLIKQIDWLGLAYGLAYPVLAMACRQMGRTSNLWGNHASYN